MSFIKKSLTMAIIIFSLHSFQNCKNSTTNNETEPAKHTNALITETSPYLLQHAHNPVDWNAWTPEVLERAKKENKLVIVSIGYSACHWCHVMEDESFEDEEVAALMNENFISIKVDREERPDIDQVYIEAVQLMTGSAGWPLNCVILPNGKPVFGGTYFPKSDWMNVLTKINDLYQKDPQKMIDYAEKVTQGMTQMSLIEPNPSENEISKSDFTETIKQWKEALDKKNGGFRTQQKFPMPGSLNTIMKIGFQTKDQSLLDFIDTTLTKMAYGGIYDQLGGGFARYATDPKWMVPHFEKMLHDNALLVSLYADAYKRTKNPLYKEVVEETLNFVAKEMTHENGAFYSSMDADSENASQKLEEGAYYVWKKDELKTLLGSGYELFKDYYLSNNTARLEGNHLILTRATSNSSFAEKHDLSLETLQKDLNSWKSILIKERHKRKHPATDDKSLTSWNALMISGYVEAYNAFGNKTYLDAALKNAQFIVEQQWSATEGLFHSFRNGKTSINGYLEDYAFSIEAFIKLYETTLDEHWITIANQMTNYCRSHFMDEQTGLFYFAHGNADALIIKKMEVTDNVIPSSNAIMAKNLFKLGQHDANKAYSEQAEHMLQTMSADAMASPYSYYQWINLQSDMLYPFYEVAIVGKDAKSKTKTLLKNYIPNILVEGATTDSDRPLLANRFVDDDTYIYVCVRGTCQLPVTEVADALKLLRK